MTDPREELTTELPPEVERALERALRAAWQPQEIDPERHEQLLALCLEDPLAEPTPEEVIASERLRRALEGEGDHPDLPLVRALAAGHSPKVEDQALPELPTELRSSEAPARGGRVIYVAFGAATTLLAAAAAIALIIGSVSRGEAPMAAAPPPAPLASAVPQQSESLAASAPSQGPSLSRSSVALFHEPFTLEQTTARVDRIAEVREHELRQNLYRSWGVR